MVFGSFWKTIHAASKTLFSFFRRWDHANSGLVDEGDGIG